MARWMCLRCLARSSWLSVSRCFIAVYALPGRSMTFSTIACVTVKLEVSGSGSAATRRSKVGWPQETNPQAASS